MDNTVSPARTRVRAVQFRFSDEKHLVGELVYRLTATYFGLDPGRMVPIVPTPYKLRGAGARASAATSPCRIIYT